MGEWINKFQVMPIYLIYSAIETKMIENIRNSLNVDEISFPLTFFSFLFL